jgi:cell division transport system permease protein
MTRLRLVGIEAVRSMGANLSTTVAATMTVLIGMFLLGVFIVLGTWVLSWSDHVKRQLEVKVDFCIGPPFDECKQAATAKEINAVRVYLENQRLDGVVKDYSFVTRAEALRRMRKSEPDLVASVAANPLPPTYEVTPAHAENVKALATDIREHRFAGVEEVRDGKQTSKRILEVATWIWRVFLVAVVILLVTSTLLIGNTIRLSIFSRRREIEVMKLVGATNWFVRGPFVLEGLLCGVIGAVAAIVLLLLGRVAWNAIAPDDTTASDVHALAFPLNALILVGVGLLVGAVGSGMTMRRFLRV